MHGQNLLYTPEKANRAPAEVRHQEQTVRLRGSVAHVRVCRVPSYAVEIPTRRGYVVGVRQHRHLDSVTRACPQGASPEPVPGPRQEVPLETLPSPRLWKYQLVLDSGQLFVGVLDPIGILVVGEALDRSQGQTQPQVDLAQ